MNKNIKRLVVCILLCAGIQGFSSPIMLEAEDATRKGVQIAKSRSGYSGTGYVTGFDNDGDQVEFNFEATAELYELMIGYATPFGQKGYGLVVNGQSSDGMLDGTHTSFTEHKAGKVQLREGANSIIITKGWGWYDIDYIKLSTGKVRVPLKPDHPLTNPNADESTKALFNFLLDNYGNKMLSGQQELAEINYIKSKTGKSPALGSFDLIDYSPSRVEHGANPTGYSEKLIKWAVDGGGIVSLSWHWNAPTDLKDEPGNEWWSGFYTRATTFDLQKALADKNSQRYKLLLRDMDVIAAELKKFQAADVPVLWRPLHEAAGGWFWWGAKGAAPYQELWRLMYDRFSTVHELTNLIWVCTPNSYDWYPGNDVVDILGLDIYTDQSSPMSGDWDEALNHMDGVKMIALSESGTMPEPDQVRTFGTWWSWFSLWTGNDFIRNVPLDILQKTYADEDVITLDELPDWRSYTHVQRAEKTPSGYELSVAPNPSNSNTTIYFRLPQTETVNLTVYNALGQSVLKKSWTQLEAGSHTIRLDANEWSSGIYFIRIHSGNFAKTVRFSLMK